MNIRYHAIVLAAACLAAGPTVCFANGTKDIAATEEAMEAAVSVDEKGENTAVASDEAEKKAEVREQTGGFYHFIKVLFRHNLTADMETEVFVTPLFSQSIPYLLPVNFRMHCSEYKVPHTGIQYRRMPNYP